MRLTFCKVLIFSDYLIGWKKQMATKKTNKGFTLPKLPFQSPHSVLKCPFVKFMVVSFWLTQLGSVQPNTVFDFTMQPLWQFGQFYKGQHMWSIAPPFFLSNKLLLCHFSSHKTQFLLWELCKRANKVWKRKRWK